MTHHAYVVAGEREEGVEEVKKYLQTKLTIPILKNPDVIELQFGLFSVADARRITTLISQAPLTGNTKVIIIATSRLYHEAQNALLKVCEEPPEGTYLFLVIPSLGALLPTLRSRLHVLEHRATKNETRISEETKAFLTTSKEKRSALIKRLATGKDEDERREHREESIHIVNDIEALTYKQFQKEHTASTQALLSDINTLRGYLYDRSAPVRMILEHLSLVLPEHLL